jgi:ABC-type phosphate transport system auxiliary subunit
LTPCSPYLIKELIAHRFEGARLSIELAEARVEAAQVKEISHGQAELLTALIAALRIRDRQAATLRAETAHSRQRLEAAQTELERERVENRRSAAELAAAQEAAKLVMMTALGNLPVAMAFPRS